MVSLFVFSLLIVFLIYERYENQQVFQRTNQVEEKLLKYENVVNNELASYQLTEMKPVILAIILQESNALGEDVMQSSESAGYKRNAINTPDESIRQGVKHFANMYKYGSQQQVDMETVIQSYNMGPGYIDFIAQNGKKHSEELAKQYSDLKVQQNPELYNCGGDSTNFRYPYCYGDFTYAEKVKDNLTVVIDLLRNQGESIVLEDLNLITRQID